MKIFSKTQIYLHWFTLPLIVLTYATMELRGFFPKNSDGYLLMRVMHYNAGILVWGVVLFRLVTKHSYVTPDILPLPPYWQMRAAKMMHTILYATFLILPLLGVILMGYGGKEWQFLGITIPSLENPNFIFKNTIKILHETLASVGYGLIGGHALAALFHHYIQKDNALIRMLPWK